MPIMKGLKLRDNTCDGPDNLLLLRDKNQRVLVSVGSFVLKVRIKFEGLESSLFQKNVIGQRPHRSAPHALHRDD